jgi:hypothetical protein
MASFVWEALGLGQDHGYEKCPTLHGQNYCVLQVRITGLPYLRAYPLCERKE